MSDTSTTGPWGPWHDHIGEGLAHCAEYLGRLQRSLAGEIAPDRHYFVTKARALRDASVGLVHRARDVERWMGACDDGDGGVGSYGLAAGHAGEHDEGPTPRRAPGGAGRRPRCRGHRGGRRPGLGHPRPRRRRRQPRGHRRPRRRRPAAGRAAPRCRGAGRPGGRHRNPPLIASAHGAGPAPPAREPHPFAAGAALGTLVAVPATVPTPGCARAVSPRSENTRPRLDRCSAHRIRLQRPHRPRSRPVFGLPLRQLASDPSVPVEGGSANANDYCSGDPVNCNDLAGLREDRSLPSELDAPCFYKGPVYDDALFDSDECLHYRTAVANDDPSMYYDFVDRGRRYDVADEPNQFLAAVGDVARPVLYTTYEYAGGCIATGLEYAAASAYVPYVGPWGGAIAGCAVGATGQYIISQEL